MNRIGSSGRVLRASRTIVGPSISGITTSLISKCDLLAAVDDLQRFLAIVGGQHLIAVPGQRALGDGADHRLVLDQQDGAGAPQLVFAAGLAGARRLRCFSSTWWTGR